MKTLFPAVQKLGRSLMLPIAVLPVAGLLLRLGQPDLFDLPFVAAAGDAIFGNLGLLFAMGVAVGLARGNNGAAGLAAMVGYLVTTEGAEVLVGLPDPAAAEAAIRKLSVPIGLICGIIAGVFYNRFGEIRLPDYLAFFAGRRFVPIVSGFAALFLAVVFGYGWPFLEQGMNALSEGVVSAGSIGLFLYGLLNRILIITGLHHILNNLAWFIVGDFEGVTGDLRRYFAGDPSAGTFMTGFFPVMMFGLPAACLAMYHAARKEQRKAVGGLLVSMALTSFLTGITEPIEFTFMFLAPALYAAHAVLTGVSMALMDLLDVRHGFGFSAGLFDYVLNYGLSTRGWLILPFGAVYFLLYYGLFRWFIVRFDVPTPGRAGAEVSGAAVPDAAPAGAGAEAAALLAALGGRDNLLDIDACTTRLRLRVASQDPIDEAALKALGAAGVLRPTADTVQVVIGLRAETIAGELAAAVHRDADDPAKLLLTVLGGRDNLEEVESFGTRLSIVVRDAARVRIGKLSLPGLRALVPVSERCFQLLADEDTAALRGSLQST
jgi:PTS system N-acetylglucosamine-specific IIC component